MSIFGRIHLNKRKSEYSKIVFVLFILISAIILAATLRGIPGNPKESDLNSLEWKESGPFELSPERGRFALIFSVIENKTFFYSPEIAKFSAPDVGFKDGAYMSLFAPGLSLITLPGYIIGKHYDIAQVGTYAVVAVFALLNVALIIKLSRLLGANKLGSFFAAFVFLFATPAFSYAVNLYQHHISTFLILYSLYLLITSKNALGYYLIFFVFGLSVAVDNPNLFFMFPIGAAAIFEMIKTERKDGYIKININPMHILSIAAVAIPLFIFMTYNKEVNGDYLKLSGSLESVKQIDSLGLPVKEVKLTKDNAKTLLSGTNEKKDPVRFFKTRHLLNGFYIHIFSPDRGMLHFTPIIFLGIIGYLISKNEIDKKIAATIWNVILVIILLYSMWGDPWGGWAFGSRYMNPLYALLSIFIGIGFKKFQGRIVINLIIAALLIFSLRVNTLGAVTTSAIPPKIQVLQLEKLSGKEEKFNYKRAEGLLNQNISKSYLFNAYANKYMSAWGFFDLIFKTLAVIGLLLIGLNTISKKAELRFIKLPKIKFKFK